MRNGSLPGFTMFCRLKTFIRSEEIWIGCFSPYWGGTGGLKAVGGQHYTLVFPYFAGIIRLSAFDRISFLDGFPCRIMWYVSVETVG